MKRILIGIIVCAALVELVLLWFYNPAEVNIFPPCLFKLVTGLKCPGCGLQRSIHLLLHGEIYASLRMCPFLYFMALVVPMMYIFPNATKKLFFALAVVSCVLTYTIARMLEFVP